MTNKTLFHVVVSWFLVIQTHAFTSPACSSLYRICTGKEGCKTSTTELFGLRTFLKKRLSKRSKSIPEEALSSPTTIRNGDVTFLYENGNDTVITDLYYNVAQEIVDTPPVQGIMSSRVPILTSSESRMGTISGSPNSPAEQQLESSRSSASVMMLESVTENSPLDEPYSLPPIGNRELTKLEQEFRNMLLDFSQYTQRDIMAVRDRRMRVIFQGVAASYALPEVYRAFEILFEDYVPLRVAGRLIYGKLKSVMEEAQLERRKEVDTVAAMTGLSREEIEASRSAYFQLVVHEDDAATEMTLQQIVDYGLAEMAVEVLGFQSFEDFVACLKPCEKERVDFGRLMVGLQSCPIDNVSPECNPAAVLQVIAKKLDSRDAPPRLENKDQRKIQLNERYDTMVERFREWKSFVPKGDGRRLEVLRGCFVGAESKEIVEALRVVYLDYSALRMSGDLIFKVMAALVGRKG